MNHVKQAIILAAGIGERMRPVTKYTPKPLVSVNGEIMIESVIKGLLDNEINEIYVVVGYLKEQFEYLKLKYPNITLIFNQYFDYCNNISSLYVAKEHLENTIILDGDQLIFNSSILSPQFERSGYNSVWVWEPTSEWLQKVENDIVVSCNRAGGQEGWQLYSISRWTQEDGNKLKKHLELEFEVNKNYHLYWDDVPMFCHFDEYKLGIRKMESSDVLEIDSYSDLIFYDAKYKNLLTGE